MVITIIQLSVFAWYVFAALFEVGLTKSISDSSLKIKKQYRFVLFSWGVGLPFFLYEYLYQITPMEQGLLAGAGCLFALVSIASKFKDKDESARVKGITTKLHYTGAVGAIGLLFWFACLHFGGPGYYALAFFIIASLALGKYANNHLYWIEILAAVMLFPFLFTLKAI